MLRFSMSGATCVRRPPISHAEAGFSLPEVMIATTILMIISGIVASGLLQATNTQTTIANRSEMHGGVRSATELLQQEVGQAGRVALPGPAKLAAAVAAGASPAVGVQIDSGAGYVASVSGIFVGEQLAMDSGDNTQETVTVSAVSTVSNTITATFANAHSAGAAINVLGGFASGIVPPSPGYTNGSTGWLLKMYGDINGDGNMMYVEYKCDLAAGKLYRNAMAFDLPAASKPALTDTQLLLGNILDNPASYPCFSYMPSPLPVVGADTYVLNVAITLTVETQLKDAYINKRSRETKALLNVSPRNVFNVWQLASAGGVLVNRIQPIPASVTSLLP
jgi:type II secretory pathway pseudopilin PulG